MAKRKKKISQQRNSNKNQRLNLGSESVQNVNSKTLEQQASQHLHKHRYKDALDNFKLLLKQVPGNKTCQQGLLSAYRGRCLQLAEKKMYKEACVIWENMQGFLEQNEVLQNSALAEDAASPTVIDYLQWYLFTGNLQKALQFYKQYEPKIKTHSDFAALNSHFAAHLLSAPEQTIKILDENHPLRSHWHYARDALTAYCSQQPEAMQLALKNIPFRSAYRDFSLILKALIVLPIAIAEVSAAVVLLPIAILLVPAALGTVTKSIPPLAYTQLLARPLKLANVSGVTTIVLSYGLPPLTSACVAILSVPFHVSDACAVGSFKISRISN